MKNTMADLAQLLLQAAEKGAADLGEPARLALLQASVKLMETLENTVERMFRLCFVSAVAEPNGREHVKLTRISRPSMSPYLFASP